MKSPWFAAVALSLALALAPGLSDAKRLGGGKSSGLQREMPARTAPDATPPRPANPQQAAPANTPGQAAAQAAASKRSWLGPLAGIAAGLGLAALMSHLGLSEAFGSFLLMAALAIAAVFVIRMIMRRMSGAPQPAAASAGAPARGVQVAWPQANPVPTAPVTPSAPAAPTAAFVPATFDSEGFERTARTLFVRLQAVNDSADLDDLRRFTTPEMFAELRTDIADRAGRAQKTDVPEVHAKVLDVADDGQRQVVSVRYTGRVDEDGTVSAFDEVWHLVKPHGDDARGWAIAGIEQMPTPA